MSRLIALVLAACCVVAACGTDDTGGTVDAGPTTTGAAVQVALVVEATETSAGSRSASVSCQANAARGTGELIDPKVAAGVCAALLNDPQAKPRLVDGPAKGVACTQQYGGPATAHVTGTFRGSAVDTTFDRKDGCGIADWDHFTFLLGAP